MITLSFRCRDSDFNHIFWRACNGEVYCEQFQRLLAVSRRSPLSMDTGRVCCECPPLVYFKIFEVWRALVNCTESLGSFNRESDKLLGS